MGENREPIIYIGGSKGGVGKSKVSFALIDYLLNDGKKVLLLETDTSNPDVYKAHHAHEDLGVLSKKVDLDISEGWIELVNVADEFSEYTIVINSAARSNTGIEKYSGTLRETLVELQRKLITFWVINRQRDSLELLRGFLNAFPDAKVHVLRNLHFGLEEKFDLYNASVTREKIEKKGGLSLCFPDLADRVADKLYSERIPIAIALKDFLIGDRAELKRWQAECKKTFHRVFCE